MTSAMTELNAPSWRGRLARPSIWWGVVVLTGTTAVVTFSQGNFTIYTFNTMLLAVMGALSLQVLHGTAGLVSVGNAAFLMVGAFSSVFMLRAGVPFPGDVILGGVIAAAAGAVVGLPALRLASLYLALSTLAAHYIVVFVGDRYQLSVPEARYSGFFVPVTFSSFGIDNGGRIWAWLLLAIVVITMSGASRLMRFRAGRALRMIRDHEHLAPTLGISVTGYKLSLFALTSGVIGIQGGLTAHLTGFVATTSFPIFYAFLFVAMIVIGGLDSVAGAIVGVGLVMGISTFLPLLIQDVIGQGRSVTVGPNVALIVYGLLLIFFVTSSVNGASGLAVTAYRRGVSRLRRTATANASTDISDR